MNLLTLSQLRGIAHQLSLLAGTFQTEPFCLRAKQIRQADKALISADAFFSPQLYQDAKQWKNAQSAHSVLQEKLSFLNENQAEIIHLEEKITQLRATTKTWFELEDNERQKILQNTKRATQFLSNQNDHIESHIIHRYKRFLILKGLAHYSENSTYLCEAIFHYENREKYEANITKLEEKIEKAEERKKNVKRGFWISIFFCLFLMTIPICLPFSISLWSRKREIENQISNHQETLRRENKRLLAADEGSIIAQEIREILGNVSLQLIRDTLIEVKELRSEFLGLERTSSSTVLVLNFLETEKMRLIEIFGNPPEDPVQMLQWLCERVNNFENTEKYITELKETKNKLNVKQKQKTKGYSKEMLLESLENLKNVVDSTFIFPLTEENKIYFAEICIEIPEILKQIRELLYFVSRNLPTDINYWNILKLRMQSFSNTFSLCILDAEILDSSCYLEQEV